METSSGPVRIRRIHLEEDTGKLQHKTVDGQKVSLIDFNRSSVPLVEIVTEPDITSPEQAKEYAKKIRQLLRYLEIADCDMEQGGMRLEANISLRTLAETEQDVLPAYKVEVKNINSFRFMEQAIGFEIQRQGLELMAGKTPTQETRGWNSTNNTTFPQRTKEDAEDYRYFPDPDLPPIRFTATQIAALGQLNPELPAARISRWEKTYGIEPRFGEQLCDSINQSEWAEHVFAAAQLAQIVPNKLAGALINKKISADESTAVDKVIQLYLDTTQSETVDTTELDTIIKQVLAENNDAVNRYHQGQTQLLNFFLGQVMKKAGKKLDANQVKNSLEASLN